MVRDAEGENVPERQSQPTPITSEGFVQAQHVELHQGPLPPPDVLGGYESVVPGAAERILRMAEQEASHRQNLEKALTQRDSNRSLLGVIGAVVVALAAFTLAGYAFYLEQPLAGSVLGGIDMAAIVGVFIYGTRRSAD